jgi:hypothetical protein
MTGFHTADILFGKCSVLDPECLFRIPIRIFLSQIPGLKDPGSGSVAKNLSIFIPKNCFLVLGNMIRDVHAGSRIWIFFPSRIPGSNEAPDPGSATLKIGEVMSIKITIADCFL